MQRQSRTFHAGLLAAVLAATLQFVLLAGSLSGAFTQSATIAHAGQCSDAPGGHDHNDAACALCPVCLAVTVPAMLPPLAPGLAPPQARNADRPALLRAAQLPPSRALTAAYPRGPPLI